MTEYQRMQIGMIYDRFDSELANKQDSMYLKEKEIFNKKGAPKCAVTEKKPQQK